MRPLTLLLGALALLSALSLSPPAAGEQSSEPAAPVAGSIAAGALHTCALLAGGRVRCWGYGAEGELGYGDTRTIGDDETPASTGPVDLGAGRTATALAAGDYHT